MTIQIFDKLSLVCDQREHSGTEDKEKSAIELRYQIDQVMKLLSFLETFAFNKLNLVCIEQIYGVDTLMELLKYFSTKSESLVEDTDVES